MDANDILQAVEVRISGRFPGEPVYRDLLPKGFQRPSFTLECTKDESADVNIALVRRSVAALVTCYAAVNEYGDSSRAELNSRTDAVLALLGAGPLAVEGRSIQAGAVKGLGSPAAGEVTVVFTWTDVRPGYRDPETATPESGGAPLMEHYAINMKRKD